MFFFCCTTTNKQVPRVLRVLRASLDMTVPPAKTDCPARMVMMEQKDQWVSVLGAAAA